MGCVRLALHLCDNDISRAKGLLRDPQISRSNIVEALPLLASKTQTSRHASYAHIRAEKRKPRLVTSTT